MTEHTLGCVEGVARSMSEHRVTEVKAQGVKRGGAPAWK